MTLSSMPFDPVSGLHMHCNFHCTSDVAVNVRKHLQNLKGWLHLCSLYAYGRS